MNSGKYPYKPTSISAANNMNSNNQQDKRVVSVLQKKRKLQYFSEEFAGVVKEFINLLSTKDESKRTVKYKKKAVDTPQTKHFVSNNRSKDQDTQVLKQSNIIEESGKIYK